METIDYAEMLEIPVSTVSVVRKKKKADLLKQRAIRTANADQSETATPDPEAPEASSASSASSALSASEKGSRRRSLSEKVLVGEFIAVCVLSATLFLTNALYPASAMNTASKRFFSSETSDTRTYQDFTLSPVLSERAEADIAVSSSGVMSFTATAAIYPVADGKVSKITKGEKTSTVEISHSDSFRSVVTGLSDVYADEGDAVKGNLPLGYADGDVRVMLYEGGTLLNCFTLDESNAVRWS